MRDRRAHSGPMRWLIRLALLAVLLVFALNVYFWFRQDSVLFYPGGERTQPAQDFMSVHELQTSDGETLLAWYAPAQPACPTLLFLHGNGGRVAAYEGRYQRIHDAGVGVLALSWRGYSGSTGEPSEAGFHKDARAAWDWLTKNQGLPDGNIIIHGHSIGSGPATRLASEVDEGALVLEAPFYSLQDLVQRRAPFLIGGIALKHPFRNDKYIAQIESPLLIVHGSKDSIIPVSQSERLFKRAREVKHYIRMEGSDHNTLTRDGLYDQIWPFIAANWASVEAVAAWKDSDCSILDAHIVKDGQP